MRKLELDYVTKKLSFPNYMMIDTFFPKTFLLNSNTKGITEDENEFKYDDSKGIIILYYTYILKFDFII